MKDIRKIFNIKKNKTTGKKDKEDSTFTIWEVMVVAITLAIISSLTGRKVKSSVAMTGEVTLRGKAFPIGGLREKSLAAARSGITTIIIPRDNEKNLVEIPTEVKEKLNIILMDTVDDAIAIAFGE